MADQSSGHPQVWVYCPQDQEAEAREAFRRAGVAAGINPSHPPAEGGPFPVLFVEKPRLPKALQKQLDEAGAASAVDWIERRTRYTEFDLLSDEELRELFVQGEQRLRRWHWLKRATDLLLALVALPLALAIFALVAPLIRLDSRGAAIFRQQRVGLDNKPFFLRKFRTMTVVQNGSLYTGEDDPRVTRVGGALRLLHLDEIPQIWNILRGDMTLIGPRPEVQENIDHHLRKLIRLYDMRHIATPGIAGWAQLRYGYPSAPQHFLYRHRYDLYYIRNYSPWLDLRILFGTAIRVLSLRLHRHPPRGLPPPPPRLREHAQQAPKEASIWVDVDNQRLVLYRDGKAQRSYPISTAANGLSNLNGSYGTPTGLHKVGERFGEGAEEGTEFVGREPSGRVLKPGELPTTQDCITTRILWLEGQDPENSGGDRDSKDRYIYIHGSPHTRTLGLPVSGGCVRMSDRDVVELFGEAPSGTPVLIQ